MTTTVPLDERPAAMATKAEALRSLLTLAWPVVLARLGIMTMGLCDAIVVGRHSAEQLAFHALGWAPTSVVLTTGVGLLLGIQVMAARMLGAGRVHETGAVLRRGLVYAGQLGLGFTGLLLILGPWGLRHAGVEPRLAEGAGHALTIFALSLPFYFLATAGQFFLEGLGRPRPGMIALWIANGVNLVLNLWLVPGHSGLPIDGAVASAWATLGARTALFVFFAIYLWRMRDARPLGLFDRPRRDRVTEAEQRRVGLAAGLSYFIEVGAFAAMSVVAGRIGGIEVAAWAVVLNVAAIIFMGPMGLSAATAVMVGQAFGGGDEGGLRRSSAMGLLATAALTAVVCLIVWPGVRAIVGAYSADPALMAIAVPALVLAGWMFIADGLQVVASQALRAAGEAWVPTVMHLFSYGVVMLPLGWVLALNAGLGVNGIVWAVVIASLVSALLLCARLWWIARRPLARDGSESGR